METAEEEAKAIAEKEEAKAIAEKHFVFQEFDVQYTRKYNEVDREGGNRRKSIVVKMNESLPTYHNKTTCAGYPIERIDTNNPPKSESFFEENDNLIRTESPAPDEGEDCAITLTQLRAVLANAERRCAKEKWKDFKGVLLTPETVNLYDVEKYIVKPYTLKKKKSFVSTLPSTGGSQVPRFLVSCQFSLPLKELLDCLEKFVLDFRTNNSDEHDKKGGGMTEHTPLWLNLFALSKWNRITYRENPCETAMAKAAKVAKYRVLGLVDKDGIGFKRTWTVFEMHLGITFGSLYIYSANSQKGENGVQKGAVGLVSGGATSDASPMDTLKREQKFPHSLIDDLIKFNVSNIEAAEKADTIHVLNWSIYRHQDQQELGSNNPNQDQNSDPDPTEAICNMTSDELNQDLPMTDAKYETFNNNFHSHFATPGTLQAALKRCDDSWQRMLNVMKKGNMKSMRFDFEDGRGWDKLTSAQAIDLIESLPHTISDLEIRCANFNNEFIRKLSDWIGSSKLIKLYVEDTFVNSCINEKSIHGLAKDLKRVSSTLRDLQIWRANQEARDKVYEEDLKTLETLATKGEADGAIFAPLESLYKQDNPNFANITFLQALFMRLEKPSSVLNDKEKKLTFTWVRSLSDERKSLLYESEAASFANTLLKKAFTKPKNLAVIMSDLYIQVIIVILLCLLNERQYDDKNIIPFLIICFFWVLFRECVQRNANDFKTYLTTPSNLVDTIQTILVFLTIVSRDHPINPSLYAMCMSWVALIFKLSNLIFPLAVFMTAFVEIVKELVSLVLTAILLLLMFAHAFRGIYSKDECIHDYSRYKDDYPGYEETEHFNNGWKTCRVWDSYINSFQMFFFDDNWNFGERSEILVMFIFALVIGVFLLNMVIAVVSNKFTEVHANANFVFWGHRLDLLTDIEAIWDLFPFLEEGIKICLIIFPGPNSITRFSFAELSSLKYVHEIAMLLDDDKVDNDEEKQYLYWWFSAKGYGGKCPSSLWVRIRVFYKYSIWEDIFYPGRVYTKVALGYKYYYDLIEKATFSWRFFAIGAFKIATWFLFMGHVLIFIVLSVGGVFSFGLLWPTPMIEYLMNLSQDRDEQKQSHVNKDTEILIKEMHAFKGDFEELRDEVGQKLEELSSKLGK